MKVVCVSVLLLLGLAPGCGGGSDGGVVSPPIVASYTGSGVSAAPDLVRLTGSAVSDVVTLNVVLGGPTTSGDLYSFAFDLVIGDPSVVQLVAGSAGFGDALTLTGGQQGEALATQSDTTVTVGVSKLGGGSGNGVSATEAVIVRLRFRVLRAGSSTIALAGGGAALDSTGSTMTGVTFEISQATIGSM